MSTELSPVSCPGSGGGGGGGLFWDGFPKSILKPNLPFYHKRVEQR